MSNEIQIFNHEEFGQVRSVVIEGDPWFVGKDVAEALGYKDTKSALQDHVDSEDKQILKSGDLPPLENHLPKEVFPINFVRADIPNRGLTIINESGVYALVFGSKLPGAKQFKRWVTSEVLPALRKTGKYEMEAVSDAEILARAVLVAQNVIREKDDQILALEEKVESQQQTIEDYQPKVEYLDTILSCPDAVTTTQIAADYDLSAKRLNVILMEEGLQRKVGGQWILYRKHMGKGYTKSETIQISHADGTTGVKMQTKWTQKGRLAIYDILKAKGIVPVMDRVG